MVDISVSWRFISRLLNALGAEAGRDLRESCAVLLGSQHSFLPSLQFCHRETKGFPRIATVVDGDQPLKLLGIKSTHVPFYVGQQIHDADPSLRPTVRLTRDNLRTSLRSPIAALVRFISLSGAVPMYAHVRSNAHPHAPQRQRLFLRRSSRPTIVPGMPNANRPTTTSVPTPPTAAPTSPALPTARL